MASYPEDQPRLMFRAGGTHTIIALSWEVLGPERSREIMANTPVTPPSASTPSAPTPAVPTPTVGLGFFGLVDYDSYAGQFTSAEGQDPTILAQVHRCLIIDHSLNNGRCVLAEEADVPSAAFAIDGHWPWRSALTPSAIPATQASSPSPSEPSAPSSLSLTPETTDEAYIADVQTVLDDIRRGRFYQLNLLRYYRAELTRGGELTGGAQLAGSGLAALNQRFLTFYEPYSLWFRGHVGNDSMEREVMSFSPERFVAIEPGAKGSTLIAEPIKGTLGRLPELRADRAQQNKLANSAKDLAELHMIVDLLRHDMWPLCEPQSIAVRHPHQLRTFQRVHHLVATIEGRLRAGLTLADCWAALLPAGSITGTPKREVMGAIAALEGRPRGWFMGIAFHFDPVSGSLDSSVLIRTIVRRGTAIHYAAGSGLVIHSQPDAERAEIVQKCRVVTDPLPRS